MPDAKTRKATDTGVSGIDIGNSPGKERSRYHVVIDGVVSEIETLASFAIKFSLLTNIPVTKMNHMMRELPASIWAGTSKSKALGLLSLVNEAGGVGRIAVEEVVEKSPKSNRTPDVEDPRPDSCKKCGFPISKEEDYCSFCMTRVGEAGDKHDKKVAAGGKSIKTSIPPERLLFYLLVVFAAVIITFVLKS